ASLPSAERHAVVLGKSVRAQVRRRSVPRVVKDIAARLATDRQPGRLARERPRAPEVADAAVRRRWLVARLAVGAVEEEWAVGHGSIHGALDDAQRLADEWHRVWFVRLALGGRPLDHSPLEVDEATLCARQLPPTVREHERQIE